MKKALNRIFFFTLLMILCCFTCAASDSSYPESMHNYENNLNQKWEYSYSRQVPGLFVTFSEKTSFEEPTAIIPSKPSTNLQPVADIFKTGDFLYLTATGYSGKFTGKELAGKTLYIPDSSFTLRLKTDSTITDYGFSIDRISPEAPENVAVVTYDCCDSCSNEKFFYYNEGEEIIIKDMPYCRSDNSAFVCWEDEEGNEYYIGDKADFSSLNLRAKRVPLLLEADETFSFSNSDTYFQTEDFSGYYMSEEDLLTMKRNTNRVFGYGSVLSLGLNTVLSTYPQWPWRGSCYGMSAIAFLQHYGVIDLLADGESLSTLKNTKELASAVNYYQWSLAGSFLCENFAYIKGIGHYSRQLKNLYNTVCDGNIALFTYYEDDFLATFGHTVLITGAYTQKDGTHVLVAYDCNYPVNYNYAMFEERFYISPDFTSIKRGYAYPADYLSEVGDFNWTSDYSHFEAFDIKGEGKARSWYSHFFRQLPLRFKTAFSFLLP